MYANKESLEGILEQLHETFSQITLETNTDLEISDDIDDEARRIPMLHSKYVALLTHEGANLSKLKTMQKKLYLERWKYYSGKLPDKYYATHGVVNDKILKTDMDRYITSDDYICLVSEICDYQKRIVDFIEKTVKDIGNRGYYLRTVVDWRKFTNGE